MYSINSKVLKTPVSEGKILLLEPEQGLYYELNEVSSLIFEGFQKNLSESQILENILQLFEVNKEEAMADLELLIQQLLEKNIINKD